MQLELNPFRIVSEADGKLHKWPTLSGLGKDTAVGLEYPAYRIVEIVAVIHVRRPGTLAAFS